MEPIVALGLVSNVVQLVDFTAKVVRKASKNVRQQDLVDHARLTLVTSDLRTQTENLKRSRFFKETAESDENGKVNDASSNRSIVSTENDQHRSPRSRH